MAQRKKYQYSIISYNQNSMRNESINIGVLLFNNLSQSAKYKIISANSFKIRGLALSQYQKDLFQTSMKYLNYLLNRLDDGFSVHLLDNTIENDLPEQIRFSKPQPVVTANEELLFNQIVSEYVGDEYFKLDDVVNILTPKEQMIDIFTAHDLLGNQIKKNIKIRPSKSLEIKFNIDFAYGENTTLNLIDSSPVKESALEDWYVKMVTLSSRYDYDSSIFLINDSKNAINADKKVSQMLSDLENDTRIHSLDISQHDELESFIEKISYKSVNSEQLNALITSNHYMAS
ncbi:DUF3037 domain-containing protein [Lactiplantibacillus plantarum]|uniref:DUF3037 domain-containing protein n=1 Tax=Lactiplantibacillus plantarum TaxID=1590 RepID=UPI0023072250|nr:DUF3037 domain-containing protein [Lactiplantibacillus plantarum]WCE42653.1 DUF3037 domain-containing protein [Lactiplantibacillus plantarum]